MKIYKNSSKKLLAGIGVVCLLSVLLSSCLKDNKNQNYNPPAALVTFIQASPNEPPLDLYLNQNKVNFHPINYGDDIDYFRAFVGERIINIFNSPVQSKIASDTVTLKQDSSYTVFLANTPNKPEIVFINDSLAKPASGQAGIRFVALSPDAPAVDLVVHAGATLSANKAYKSHSVFVPIQAATYTFDVVQHGTTTVLASVPSVPINGNFLYTIWFYGLKTPTNNTDKLGASIVANAYYY